MKILVIGKNGQLAQALHNESSQFSFQLVQFDSKTLDIRDFENVQKIILKEKPHTVINTAAFNLTQESEDNPATAFELNCFAVKNLADICRKNKIRFVTYSTDYVFDGKKNKPYIETDCPRPLQMYGLSKLAGEYACLNTYPESIVIRSSFLYGGKTGSPVKKTNIVLRLLKELKDNKEVEVSSEQTVSPTYVVDLARATFELLLKKDVYGIYHLVNEGMCTWVEFAQKIIELRQIQSHIIPVDRKGQFGISRPLYSALLNYRAHKKGVKLPAWEDALKRYLDFLG